MVLDPRSWSKFPWMEPHRRLRVQDCGYRAKYHSSSGLKWACVGRSREGRCVGGCVHHPPPASPLLWETSIWRYGCNNSCREFIVCLILWALCGKGSKVIFVVDNKYGGHLETQCPRVCSRLWLRRRSRWSSQRDVHNIWAVTTTLRKNQGYSWYYAVLFTYLLNCPSKEHYSEKHGFRSTTIKQHVVGTTFRR